MSDVILLASEFPAPLPVTRVLGRAVCALGAGEGPFLNPKTSPNEDSVFMVERGGALLAGVADSHFGHQAGERLVRNLLREVEREWPVDAASLREAVLRADEAGVQWVRDRSESTLAVVLVNAGMIHWVNVADSILWIAGATGMRELNVPTGVFGGGTLSLRMLQQYPAAAGIEVVDAGSVRCAPGEVLLVCSDGLLEETSGVPVNDVLNAVRAPGPLEERVMALARRACSKDHGGGRDNISIIAVEIE